IGELWYILPFSQFFDGVVSALRDALKDPFASLHTATILYCGIKCTIDNRLAAGCNLAYWLWDIIGFVEQVVGLATTIYQDIDSGGLQYCDSVLD
ncbi:MAG: hypothetical protein KJ597_00830, partial [Nanoarchaeota archaeon]|nr:hypothetical protein [Nanoarchaeota archaeon]